MRRPSGFTLIELVVVMVVISVGLLGIASLFSNTAKGLSINESMQQAAQYAQECAEHVLAVRYDLGFTSSSINDTMCNALGTTPGFTRTVTNAGANDTYTCPSPQAPSCSACPPSATCRNVAVTVDGNSVSSSITIMLVNY